MIKLVYFSNLRLLLLQTVGLGEISLRLAKLAFTCIRCKLELKLNLCLNPESAALAANLALSSHHLKKLTY